MTGVHARISSRSHLRIMLPQITPSSGHRYVRGGGGGGACTRTVVVYN